jgi:hypothetical protein
MKAIQGSRWIGRWLGLLAVAVVLVGASACGMMMSMTNDGPERPADSEFGLGPRRTAEGLYQVTLEPAEPLVQRKLLKLHVRVLDRAGQPVRDAGMSVDGGMPEHGHGLPTRPRMTRQLDDGRYEIDGVRFNMGGWWEFRLAISAPGGTDSVTFNIDL